MDLVRLSSFRQDSWLFGVEVYIYDIIVYIYQSGIIGFIYKNFSEEIFLKLFFYFGLIYEIKKNFILFNGFINKNVFNEKI